MTITLDLPDDLLARLRADANAQGRPEGEIIAEHLAAVYAAPRFDPADVEAIRQGIADADAGRERPFEEFVAEQRAERAQRTARRSAA